MTARPSISGARRSTHLPTLVAVGLAAIAAVGFLVGPVAWAAGNVREGFPGYFTAARLVADDRWSPSVYDDAWFARETLAVTGGRLGEIYRPNPPVVSIAMLPIAGFELMTARRAWLGVEVVLAIVSWLLLVAALPALRAPPLALGLLALVLAWEPLQLDVRMGQVYGPLLGLHAAALLAVLRPSARGHAVAGVALGVAAAAKLAALPWLAALLVRSGGRRAFAAAALTALILAALSLGFAGVDGWRAFAGAAWHDLTADRPSLAVTAYQSTGGLLRHLLTIDPTWNPGGLVHLPLVARGLGLAVSAWVVVVTLLVARRGSPDLVAGTAVTAGLLAVNVAQDYAYAVLLVPAAIAISRWVTTPVAGRGRAAWLALAIFLIAAPLPYRDPSLDAGWLALLAYPRLYGAWLLWAWLVREIGREAVASGESVGGGEAAARHPQRATADTR